MPKIVSVGQVTITDTNDGMNILLSKESFVIPTAQDGTGGVFTSAVVAASVVLGRVDDTANWTFGASPSAGVSGNLAGNVYSVSGMTVDAGTVTISANRAGYAALSRTFSIAKARAGAQGINGLNVATVQLYKRTTSAVAPAVPTADTEFTFASGVLTGITNGWSQAIPSAGGGYLHTTTASAANIGAKDTIVPSEWAVVGLLSVDGVTGSQSAEAKVYQWALLGAPTISGTSTINFSTGAITSIPVNWTSAPGLPPAAGFTLYTAMFRATGTGAATTGSINWSSATITQTSYAGTDGNSRRICFTKSALQSLAASPNIQTDGSATFPPNGSWTSGSAVFVANPPVLVAGEILYQSDGIYSPSTNKTIWLPPYQSSLKVARLSAITVDTGDLNVSGVLSSANGDFYVDNLGRAVMKALTIYNPDGSVLLQAGTNGIDYTKIAGTKPPANATAGAAWGSNISGQPTDAQLLNNRDNVITNPGGGVRVSQGDSTGALKIRLPQSWTSTMLRFTVDIFEYDAGYSCTMEIAGYNYGEGYWVNVTARVIGGSNVEYPVSFGHDGTKCCVWVGTAGTNWRIPQVRVKDVFLGYSATTPALWENGWQLSFDAAGAANVTATVLDTMPGADWAKLAKRPADAALLNSYNAMGGNLCFNSDFSAGAKGWTVSHNPVNATVSFVDAEHNGGAGVYYAPNYGAGEGSGSLQVQQSGTSQAGLTQLVSDRIPVVAGKRYCVSAYTGAHRCSVDVWLQALDAAGQQVGAFGANIDMNAENYAGGPKLSEYKRHQQFGLMPSDAVCAVVILRKFNTTYGSDSWMFVSRVQVEEVGSTATTAGPWSSSGAGRNSQNNNIAIVGNQLQGIGSGAGTAVVNSAITISTTGVLQGAGGGMVETTPVIDGRRYTNELPNWAGYPVGTTREFKAAGSIGLVENEGYWCTLETIKQYSPGGGGYPGYQYALQHDKTWRRRSGDDAGTYWLPWVRDLDREVYIGDLDASKDLALIPRGLVVRGNTITKPSGSADWNADAYSKEGHVGGAFASARIDVLLEMMFGLDSNPTENTSFNTIDHAVYVTPSGNVYYYRNGTGGWHIGTVAAGDVLTIAFDGSYIRHLKNGVVMAGAWDIAITTPLYFDCSFLAIGASLSQVKFGPLTSNAWASILGAGKPQNDATNGATLGVNVYGTINASNSAVLIGEAAIKLAHVDKATIGSLSALTATIGTLQTATSGARTVIKDNVIKVYDINNNLRVQIGDLSL